MKFYILPGAAALALGACSFGPTPLPVVADQQAATNGSVVSPFQYQDPLAGYTYRAPTGPRDWRSVNEEQTEGS